MSSLKKEKAKSEGHKVGPVYTMEEWSTATKLRYKSTEDQHTLAERVLSEASQLIEETTDTTIKNKTQVDFKLQEKLSDLQFYKEQLEGKKQEMDEEIDTLVTNLRRLTLTRQNLTAKAIQIAKDCMKMREKRRGVDLCADQVDIELHKEVELYGEVNAMVDNLIDQVKEQLRRLRALNFVVNKDLEDKETGYQIDKFISQMKETDLNLTVYHGDAPLDPAVVTFDEWVGFTQDKIHTAHKELIVSRPLRMYVQTVLGKVVADLKTQYNATNQVFKSRINEYKEVKHKLEQQHAETVKRVNDMTKAIDDLKKAISDKEGFLALNHTRLGHRAQRPGIELCKDEVEASLIDEITKISETVTKLQQQLAEASASLRYLLRVQVELEEEINIKINSIKIDEVDCGTLRLQAEFRVY